MAHAQNLKEKAATGWIQGCNSNRNPWLLNDGQYRWGVNVVNRGGLVRTRYGNRMRLTLPNGKLQGMARFKVKHPAYGLKYECLVVAVSGKVYYAPFPLVQPLNWELQRLQNISFSETADQIFFATAKKSVSTSNSGAVSIVDTYNVLVMQDNINQAAYWDGHTNAHSDESEDAKGIPRGSWMMWSGDRLWVARDDTMLAGDLADPLTFSERLTTYRGDFQFDDTITGLVNSIGDNASQVLVVFTANNVSTLKSSIRDRAQWSTTAQFQNDFITGVGCVAGKSIVQHAGLLWWYSANGLLYVDSAAAAYISSQNKYRDIEMAASKRNFAPDLSNICGTSFGSYMMMSVPSGDTYNAHTMVLDTAMADELYSDGNIPAWQGVWTGFRPVEWVSGLIENQSRVFFASVDYTDTGGSYNHVWEAFQQERADVYDITNADGLAESVKQRIYCSFESKLLGDGLDMKQFRYAQLFLAELSSVVDLKVSYGGTKGGYRKLLETTFAAVTSLTDLELINASPTTKADVQTLLSLVKWFKPQERHIFTEEAPKVDPENKTNFESPFSDSIDRAFGLYIQWCGDMALDAFRIFMADVSEQAAGTPQQSELDGKARVVTEDGTAYIL